MTDAGAERAARYGLHFLPQGRRQVLDTWRVASDAAGNAGAAEVGRRVGIIRPWLVTDDRERDWPPIRDAERYRMEVYARFFAEADASFTIGSRDDIPQRWIVGDAAEVEAQLGAFIEELGLTDVITHGVPPGLRPERLTPSLVRFAREVMPALRARFDT